MFSKIKFKSIFHIIKWIYKTKKEWIADLNLSYISSVFCFFCKAEDILQAVVASNKQILLSYRESSSVFKECVARGIREEREGERKEPRPAKLTKLVYKANYHHHNLSQPPSQSGAHWRKNIRERRGRNTSKIHNQATDDGRVSGQDRHTRGHKAAWLTEGGTKRLRNQG